MASSEWQTVTKRSSTAATSTYIPPHLRKNVPGAPAQQTTVNLNNEAAFPSLGGKIASPKKAIEPQDFKQKVHDLIAFERRSENEKAAAAELARLRSGNVYLPLGRSVDNFRRFNEQVIWAMNHENEHGIFVKDTGIPAPSDNDNKNKVVVIELDTDDEDELHILDEEEY